MGEKSSMRTVSVLTTMLFVFGCATSPDKISPSYVSPLQYQSYSCSQIEQEFARIGRRVSEVTGQQQRERTKDQWAFGIGMVLFWLRYSL